MKKKIAFAPLSPSEIYIARVKLTVYIFAASLLTLLCASAAVLCVSYSYDPALNYFSHGVSVYILCSLLALTCIYAIVTSFLICRRGSDDKVFNFSLTERVSISAIYPVLASAGCAFARYYERIAVQGKAFTTFDKILLILSLLSAVYFVLSGFVPKIGGVIKLLFGLCAMLSLGLYAVEAYFEYSLEMNSPVKLFLQFGVVLCMVYIASELRFSVGTPKPRFYYVVAIVTSVACIVSAVVYVTLYIKGRINSTIYLSENILLVAMLLYITSRSTRLSCTKPIPTAPADIDGTAATGEQACEDSEEKEEISEVNREASKTDNGASNESNKEDT